MGQVSAKRKFCRKRRRVSPKVGGGGSGTDGQRSQGREAWARQQCGRHRRSPADGSLPGAPSHTVSSRLQALAPAPRHRPGARHVHTPGSSDELSETLTKSIEATHASGRRSVAAGFLLVGHLPPDPLARSRHPGVVSAAHSHVLELTD